MKQFVKKLPGVGNLARHMSAIIKHRPSTIFSGSKEYWEARYQSGGNSGVGSYGKFATFKAEVINAFVADHSIKDVIELGCGDGNQLELAQYPRYLGLDVSDKAIAVCRERFAADGTKRFKPACEYAGEVAELSLSLDVIYHLVEDDVFDAYMHRLLAAASRYSIIYASNMDHNTTSDGSHVRHRAFTAWIESHRPEWKLMSHIPNRYPYKGDYREGSFADFFIFRKHS